MTAFANHFAFQFKTGLRNPSQLVMNYLFPLVFYVMMGLVMTHINPQFAETLVPAMAIVAAMSSGVLGLPGSLVESREAGIYRSFKVNGVSALSILTIPVITTVFEVLAVTALITLTAPAFGGTLPADWGAFLAVTLAMGFSYGSIGALIGVVSADSRATVLLSQILFAEYDPGRPDAPTRPAARLDAPPLGVTARHVHHAGLPGAGFSPADPDGPAGIAPGPAGQWGIGLWSGRLPL
jgi:ABC-2 type transport system permease protein